MKIKQERRRKRILKRLLVILCTLAAFAAVFALMFFFVFKVKTVEIEGNEIYDDATLSDMIFADPKCGYTLYLFAKYNILTQKDMPFISDLEVKMNSPRSVSIVVYEKAIIGYVKSEGVYYYFDGDGVVTEASDTLVETATEVTGLDTENISETMSLGSTDDDVLEYLLDLTKLLEKYELDASSISVKGNAITFVTDDITVKLGKNSYTEAKVLRLSEIIKNLEGSSGQIDMSEWTKSSDDIVFQKS